MLFHKPPTYTHLKVFGCLAFAPNPMRTTDKFQLRGVPCLFLGYPHNQKCYVLMNLLTKHLFVSRDVKFTQHIFPYKQSSLSQYMQPPPSPLRGTQTWTEDYLQLTPLDILLDNPYSSFVNEISASAQDPRSDHWVTSESTSIPGISTPTQPSLQPVVKRYTRTSKLPS